MSPIPASGRQCTISSGGYTAVITSVGGSLRSLEYDGVPLIDAYEEDAVREAFHGSPLAPWPNRLAGGRYEFEDKLQQVALTEPERGTALHGLVCWNEWEVFALSDESVTIVTTIPAQLGYPHRLDIVSTYSLSAKGLTWGLNAFNAGTNNAPVGLGTHAFLRPGTGLADDWTIQCDASDVLETTPESLLPKEWHPVDRFSSGALDFRTPTSLTGVEVDHCFGGLPDGMTTATLTNSATGHGVSVSWDASVLPWVQICSSDFPGTNHYRTGVAIEPVTCPPDAFNSGDGLIVLAPGEQLETEIHIQSVAL